MPDTGFATDIGIACDTKMLRAVLDNNVLVSSKRAARGDRVAFEEVLAMVPDVAPDDGDAP